MSTLLVWEEAMRIASPPPPPQNLFNIPRSTARNTAGVQEVRTASQAESLLQLAMERPLSHVGFDFEYRYSRQPVPRGKGERYDIVSIVPLLLSLALVEPTDRGTLIYRFVVDLRDIALQPSLAQLLRLPVPFVAHYAKGDLFCLWQLGLPEPAQLWDTWVGEKAINLGREHAKYKISDKVGIIAEIEAKEEIEITARLRYSLVDTCRRYGVELASAQCKGDLQASFLDFKLEGDFTVEQIEYAAEDALAVAELYPLQVLAIMRSGSLHHLLTVELPWTITAARMEWTGIQVDAALADQIRRDCEERLPPLEHQLKGYGLANASSNPQVLEFFDRVGLLHLFAGSDGAKFEKKILKRHADRHPAIPLIMEYRQLRSLLSDGMLDSFLIGCDGRFHPEHRQLGTHTGRQTSKNPNALGLPGSLRPLVVPVEGYGIGEVDLCQIEVGVTAAVYGDAELVKHFNSGDVYSAMAQQYFSEELDEADCCLGGAAFKKAHPEKRNTMKTATLAMIYGTGVDGLASQLGVSRSTAQRQVKRFWGLFPALELAKTRSANCSARRGYAATVSGMRRHRGKVGRATGWELRWLANFPVQGSAAVAFKMAGNKLDRLYSAYGARLLLPMHDAFVFEAPLIVMSQVAELTARVLCEAVQECFPELRPRAEINISHPECWNKDGDLSILERTVEGKM